MGVNSFLQNFGTPGVGSGDRSAVYQPVLQNRFRATFYNFGPVGENATYDLTRQCISCTLPKLKFEEITLYTYSQPTYIINRGEWETVEIKFYDDIANTVMSLIQNQLSKQMSFLDQTYARAGENYKFDFDIDVLAGGATAGSNDVDPNIIRKWSFGGCMITDDDLGEMNVQEQKQVELSITVRFDNCVGFDENGNPFGLVNDEQNIAAGSSGGILTTLGSANAGISVSGASISVGAGINLTF